MGKNIIGENFNKYVFDQVNTRQNLLSNFSPSGQSQQAYYASTPYIRLSSSVRLLTGDHFVTDTDKKFDNLFAKYDKNKDSEDYTRRRAERLESRTVLKQLERLGINRELLVGDNLAKACVLYGGVANIQLYDQAGEDGDFSTDDDYTTYTMERYGDIKRDSKLFSGAYGWGDIGERGLVPMPGVTNIQTKYYNNGALSQATINIRCYSRLQFAIIDALYLRPGYTLLLEFGHSKYYKNENSGLITETGLSYAFPSFMLGYRSFGVFANYDQYDLYGDIENYREYTGGNYEAVYGKISKFSWNFNPEGFYECTVNVIGFGSIIESLQAGIGTPSFKLLKRNIKRYDSENYTDAFLQKLQKKSKSLLHAEFLSLQNTARALAGGSSGIYKKYFVSFAQYSYQIEKDDEGARVSREAVLLDDGVYSIGIEDKKLTFGTRDVNIYNVDRITDRDWETLAPSSSFSIW